MEEKDLHFGKVPTAVASWKEISKNKGFALGTLGIMGINCFSYKLEPYLSIVENKEKGGVYRSVMVEQLGNTLMIVDP